jgi:hypothetical protein
VVNLYKELQDLDAFGRIILKCILNGIGGNIARFCEHGNELSGSIKCREFLD